ncbi:hypothetical protein ABKV19_000917 [Rosa sericea]
MAATSVICPWTFLDEGASTKRSYASVVRPSSIPIVDLPAPVVQDGKTTVMISEEAYQSGLNKCKHMLLGRLQLAFGDKPYSPPDLQRRLGVIWSGLGSWTIIPMGKGYYSFNFASADSLARVWAQGAIALKPGTLRFMKWVPNFSPASQKNTNAQVWVRFWNLGLEFWEARTLSEIASGIGVPVKIDPNTLERKYGLFARVLVDVDLSTDLPLEVVIKRKNGEIFVQAVDYEKLPDLCSHCGNVGHRVTDCKFVKPSANESNEHSRYVRGRSRKRGAKQSRKRVVSQVYVPKQRPGKEIIVQATPTPIMDDGEGPSFVQKSPLVQENHDTEGMDKSLCDERDEASGMELVVSTVSVPIEGATLQVVDNVVPQVGDLQETEGFSPQRGATGGVTTLDSWFDETERDVQEGEFTVVQSKAQKKNQKRQAALASNREAYLHRSKSVPQ